MGDEKTPVAYIMDLDAMTRLLWRAAYANSMNLNTDMVMVDTESFAMRMNRWRYNASLPGVAERLARGQWVQSSFAMEPQSAPDQKILQDAEGFFRNSCDFYAKCASRGGSSVAEFLLDKERQIRHALESVRYKAEACCRVNGEVMQVLNHTIDTVHRIKVINDVAFVVIGAFLPFSWLACTAIGAGYTLACSLASSIGEVQSSDLVGFLAESLPAGWTGTKNAASADNLKSNAAGTAGNLATDYGPAWAARKAYLAAKAQAENIRLKDMMETRVRSYATQQGAEHAYAGFTPGQNFTAAQVRRIEQGFGKIAAQEQTVQKAVNVSNAAQALKWGARGASIGIGLYFMKDEIVKAWYGATKYEEMQSHKPHSSSQGASR